MNETRETNAMGGLVGSLIRFILVAVILGIASYLTPGFSINGMWSIIIAAVAISVIDYAVERLLGVDASPFGKGLKGFVVTALILYFVQFIVPNMKVSIIGSILAAIVIGILDAFLPGRVM